uniref:30S ribosomal protein S19 n=1 Tax=Nephromyces sp. ex Molgula occidentalis TaxID=2544991 RepID=A0A5C1H8X8_9APIC|nr:30S ribosomal protein S19 [Nephromyces sp. ex Molgula occidentalis]
MIKLLKKYPFISKDILRKQKNTFKKKNIYIKNKSIFLIIIFKNYIFYVYNGYKYIFINWNYKKLGYKIGIFIKTKKYK